jgi:hypothetical protein
MKQSEWAARDRTIVDAEFEDVRQSNDRTGPQFALWLSRGFLVTILCAALALFWPFDPDPDVELASAPPSIVTASAIAAAARQGATPPQPSESTVETVTLLPVEAMRRPIEDRTAVPQSPSAHLTEPSKNSGATSKRVERNDGRPRSDRTRRRKAARTMPGRALYGIAYRAKRTLRAVGRVFSRPL